VSRVVERERGRFADLAGLTLEHGATRGPVAATIGRAVRCCALTSGPRAKHVVVERASWLQAALRRLTAWVVGDVRRAPGHARCR
jgi:hypothetical protein